MQIGIFNNSHQLWHQINWRNVQLQKCFKLWCKRCFSFSWLLTNNIEHNRDICFIFPCIEIEAIMVQSFPEFVWQIGQVFQNENISYIRSFRMFHCNSGTDVLWICLKKSSGWRPDVSHSDKISLKSWIEENLRLTSASFYSREES